VRVGRKLLDSSDTGDNKGRKSSVFADVATGIARDQRQLLANVDGWKAEIFSMLAFGLLVWNQQGRAFESLSSDDRASVICRAVILWHYDMHDRAVSR
jgi:hypothetical protein